MTIKWKVKNSKGNVAVLKSRQLGYADVLSPPKINENLL